jgi:glycosyltransferase involved in cell wall biosynthesis
MTLVASMICRNELRRYLPLVINHLLTFCDEIRVLDDGSNDGTFEYLEGIPRVFILRSKSPHFFEHEGEARQLLLEWTIEAKPTYVLSIDADEFVGSPELVLQAVAQGGPVYTLQMEEVWTLNENHLNVRVDGHWGPRPCPILWRAPQELNDYWAIPPVKLACGREPIQVRRTRARPTRSSVYHFGWTRESERVPRAERYFEHDKGRFHRDAHLQSILWPPEKVVLRAGEWPKGLRELRNELIRMTQ